MAYSVVSGEILPGVLYVIASTQAVTYNGISYISGQTFRGIIGVATFTGSGEVNEIQELWGGALEQVENGTDLPAVFAENTLLKGMAIEFVMNEEEKIVHEVTRITGFSLELIDYPFFSFAITETRL
ncbi:MAG: hypothetical protein JWR38_5241 [Mucilaginibacter sp.]|nr:hypothetical protein [Mucilaginibacter sp.]